MRTILSLLITCFLITSALFAQDKESDQKLLVRFTAKELAHMRLDEPEMLTYWNYYADARCMQTQMPSQTLSIDIPEVEFDLEDVNYLRLDLEDYHEKGGQVRVSGTNTLLVIKPEKMFRKELGWE